MKTLELAEATEWTKAHKITLNAGGKPLGAEDGLHKRRFEVPQSANKHLWFCRFIESSLRPWSRCLFWVTAWGIWESSENWHLYYRLRQSYGDLRLLEEAPAHLFLDYETNDLISFLQIGLSAGWDFRLLTDDGRRRAFVSHDEWVEFMMHDEKELEEINSNLGESGIKAIGS